MKRQAVELLKEQHRLGVTRACGLVGISRSLNAYRSTRADSTKLRERICEIAAEKRRYGYRRIQVLLRREGWRVNRKRTYLGGSGKLGYALGSSSSRVRDLESYLAMPFRYPKLDLVVNPNGSRSNTMENTSAISYGERTLAVDERTSLIYRRVVDYTHAHEIAHHWFGNLVTPAWWSDSWLSESFAEWATFRILLDREPGRDFERSPQRLGLLAMDEDSWVDSQAIAAPIRTTDDIGLRLTRLMYEKGNAVLRMIEEYMGPEAFQAAMQDYLQRHVHGTARTEDMLNSLDTAARMSDKTVSGALRSFLEQPGVPLVNLEWSCAGDRVSVKYAQSRYVPLGSSIEENRSWRLPLCLSLHGGQGRAEARCRLLDRRQGRFELPVERCPDAVMPNADGRGYYRFALPAEATWALTRRIGTLSTAEALSLEDSLWAAVEGGRVDASTYLSSVTAFAAHPAWDVAVAPVPRLALLLRQILDGSDRNAARAFASRLYQPLIRSVGWSDWTAARSSGARSEHIAGYTADEAAQLRDALVPFMALDVGDSGLLDELAAAGAEHSGFPDRGRRPSWARAGLESSQVPLALTAAAMRYGPEFIDHLIARLTDNAAEMPARDIVAALGNIRVPSLAATVRGSIVSGRVPAEHIVSLLTVQASIPDVRDGLWPWMRAHLQKLHELVPAYSQAELAAVIGSVCKRDAGSDVAVLSSELSRRISGAADVLRMARERAEHCSALRERQSASIISFIGAQGGSR